MDTETFKELFYRIKDKLYRYSLRIVHDSAVAEDVVQEVMIKFWKGREKMKSVDNIDGWLMVMTRNRSIDKIRSKHHQTSELNTAFGMQDDSIKPDKKAETNDLMDRLKEILKTLPEKQQSIFHLRDIEGLKYKEISDALNISLDEVKVNLFRARQKLKKQLILVESYGL